MGHGADVAWRPIAIIRPITNSLQPGIGPLCPWAWAPLLLFSPPFPQLLRRNHACLKWAVSPLRLSSKSPQGLFRSWVSPRPTPARSNSPPLLCTRLVPFRLGILNCGLKSQRPQRMWHPRILWDPVIPKVATVESTPFPSVIPKGSTPFPRGG